MAKVKCADCQEKFKKKIMEKLDVPQKVYNRAKRTFTYATISLYLCPICVTKREKLAAAIKKAQEARVGDNVIDLTTETQRHRDTEKSGRGKQ